MKGKVTSNKLDEANKWLAKINSNEKELKFVVEKDVSYVYLTFYLRSEKIYSKYKKMLKNKSKILVSEGWSIGESKMSYADKDIFIYSVASEGVSCVELQFKFSIGKNIPKDIESKIETIHSTLQYFKENIDELKISMDIKYSLSKDVTISEEKVVSILNELSFEKIFNIKDKYRKFEIMSKHNITDYISIQEYNKYINLDICINVENIVVDDFNLTSEIMKSMYFLDIEYAKIHYKILEKLDKTYIESQQEFYNKLKQIV